MSWLGKDDLTEARKEFEMLKKISIKQELKEITIWDINSTYDLVQIAKRVLEAKIMFRQNNVEQAISLLKEAIEIEDALNYNEPPDWFFSVRHELGAMQLDAGLYRDAFDTYQEDLKNFPENGWSLKGLAIACSRLGDSVLLSETESKFRAAWRTADIELRSSVVN
jgi:tetratricopeptide (TPR) repeat protein